MPREPEVTADEELEAAPGVLVYRFDAPLFFANADYFVDQAGAVFDRAGSQRFVLDFEAVTLVDVTAARALKRLLSDVKSRGAELCVARASRAVHHQMDEAGLVEAIGSARFYPSVRAAVRGDGLRRRGPERSPPE
jgi:SulP family sulfate permease